jgi:hypothetical protein
MTDKNHSTAHYVNRIADPRAIEHAVFALQHRLHAELVDWLPELIDPDLADGETLTNWIERHKPSGSNTEPGIFYDGADGNRYTGGGQWIAWDYHPDGSGDVIKVSQTDVTER